MAPHINMLRPKISTEKKDRKLSIRLADEEWAPIAEMAAKFDLSMAFITRSLIRAGLGVQGQDRLILSSTVGHGRAS